MRIPSEIKIGKYTLAEILERHLHWINGDFVGLRNRRADLSCANLSHAELRGANLRYADLRSANLKYADLRGADLSSANLIGADFRYANLCSSELSGANLCYATLFGSKLSGANLRCADLRGAKLPGADLRYTELSDADLSGADLSFADLRDADLSGADLKCADLRFAKGTPYITMACPAAGSFKAWKKVNNYLVELEIPTSAKRCSATTKKCRASEAKVLGIYTLDGKKTDLKHVLNTSQPSELDYIVGETIYPDFFDEDRWHECSHGIHFFISKQDAINY